MTRHHRSGSHDAAPIRVLVVDDSAFARKVLRKILSDAEGIEVVGIARDGLEALEQIAALKPDVITLDLVMPNLDGLGVLAALPAVGAPRVVVVSISGDDSELVIEALQRGAVDLVQKPTALATDRLFELSAELVLKVQVAAGARPMPPAAAVDPVALVAKRPAAFDLLVIGASTGGPAALTRLVADLPADLPCAVALVLHIPPGYTEAFARRIDKVSRLSVVEASDGIVLGPGLIVVARGGMHLKVHARAGGMVGSLDVTPVCLPHRPSVDVLFESAAQACGARTIGIVLTGMGNDGLAGSRAIRAAGGSVLTESESSCVVYGMPRSVDEAGMSNGSAPIERMAQLLVDKL